MIQQLSAKLVSRVAKTFLNLSQELTGDYIHIVSRSKIVGAAVYKWVLDISERTGRLAEAIVKVNQWSDSAKICAILMFGYSMLMLGIILWVSVFYRIA